MSVTHIPTFTGTMPSRTQSREEFSNNADQLMSDLPAFVAGANTLADEVDALAVSCEASSAAAVDASVSAAAAANFKGAWSSLTGALAIPASVSHDGSVYMLTAGVADVTAHTPGVSASWMLLSPIRRLAIFSTESATREAVSGLEIVENSNPSGVVAGGGLSYGVGLFISDLPSSGSSVFSSPDGVTWTARAMPSSGAWKVAFGNGAFVACIPGSTTTAKSVDGIIWSAGGALPAAASASAVPIYALGNWIIDTTASAIAISNNNGTNWSSQALPEARGTGRTVLAGSTPLYWTSSSGCRRGSSVSSWSSAVSLPFTPSGAFHATTDFDGALLAGLQSEGATVYRTTDGSVWTDTGKTWGEFACTINGVYASFGNTLGQSMTWHNGESMPRRSKGNFPGADYTKRIATSGTVYLVPSSLSGCVTRIAPSDADAKKAAFV